jgi:hypothetical protein
LLFVEDGGMAGKVAELYQIPPSLMRQQMIPPLRRPVVRYLRPFFISHTRMHMTAIVGNPLEDRRGIL